MIRSATWTTRLVTAIALTSLLGCGTDSPPDERSFRRAVAEIVVEAAKRSGSTVDGDDPVKTIVFDEDSIPSALQDVETMVKQDLEGVGIDWVDAVLQGDARNLPGQWTTFGRDSTLKFNRTHSVLYVIVEGGRREREVEWGLVCGPACGYGQRVRFEWSDEAWRQEVVGELRY